MAAGKDAEVWQEILGRDASGAYPSILLDRRYHRREIAGLADTPGWRAVFADRKAVVFVEDELAQRLDLPPALPPASAAEAGAPESG